MNLDLVSMDRKEARAKFLEYRRSVRARHSAEDEALMRCYRVLAGGRQVIDVGEAIREGGTVARKWKNWRGDISAATLPALAIARADGASVLCRMDGQHVVFFTDEVSWRATTRMVRLPRPLDYPGCGNFRAMVPPVPPALRPEAALSNYHILFEAEWAQDHTRPPGDPALLKRIGGNLFAVLAIWDLTPIEKKVLGALGRMPSPKGR